MDLNFFLKPNNGLFDNTIHFNGTPRINSISLAEHSYWVTLFASILADEFIKKDLYEFKGNIVNKAIFHDYDENFTGDITHELKHNPYNGEEIKSSIWNFINHNIKEMVAADTNKGASNNIFNFYRNNIGFGIQESDLIKKHTLEFFVKLADLFSMYKYCYVEYKLGNSFMEEKIIKIIKLAKQKLDLYKKNIRENKGNQFYFENSGNGLDIFKISFNYTVKELEKILENL